MRDFVPTSLVDHCPVTMTKTLELMQQQSEPLVGERHQEQPGEHFQFDWVFT